MAHTITAALEASPVTAIWSMFFRYRGAMKFSKLPNAAIAEARPARSTTNKMTEVRSGTVIAVSRDAALNRAWANM